MFLFLKKSKIGLFHYLENTCAKLKLNDHAQLQPCYNEKPKQSTITNVQFVMDHMAIHFVTHGPRPFLSQLGHFLS